MDSYGLYQKYKVNRLLYGEEIDNQILQSVPSHSEPWHGLSIIKMNSTFLECTGKFYEEKGLGPLTLFVTFGSVFGPLLADWEKTLRSLSRGWFDILFLTVCVSPILLLGWWLFHRETRYTHYPIRFNRKTRKVYVFRSNGTVMVEDWDKLYFTLGKHWITEVEIRAHRMSEERRTWKRWFRTHKDCYEVLETFALPWSQTRNSPYLMSQWEFVRRYMEEPEELDNLAMQVDVVMPVADRRETFMHGFMRHFALAGGGVGSIILTPFFFVLALGRWVVMHVARQPKWPQEVEDACKIEPDDPWQLDAPPRDAEPTPVWNYATNAPHDGKRPDYVC